MVLGAVGGRAVWVVVGRTVLVVVGRVVVVVGRAVRGVVGRAEFAAAVGVDLGCYRRRRRRRPAEADHTWLGF